MSQPPHHSRRDPDGDHGAGFQLAADPDRLWCYAEFAEWVGVPERTVRQWCAKSGGPRTVRLGRHVRIRVGDALAWLDAKIGDVA